MKRPAVAATTVPEPCTVALRSGGSTLVEFPLALGSDAMPWVAIVRRAASVPEGWARQFWWPAPDGAGWSIPHACVFGAVVEFGADPRQRRRGGRRLHRWYGIAVAHDHDWLVVHGPYPHPADADRQAAEWLATARAYAVALHDPTGEPAEPGHRPSVTGGTR